ncbi:MAG: Smr/MutS family protein, partial [Lysobacter spongiicola]|nr:Smr/MutS family protein [Lysobacter spongiicola]
LPLWAFRQVARRHGKGRFSRQCKGRSSPGSDVGSRGAPVLKNLVDRMLRQRASVLGFHSAPRAQGGTGAVLVLIAPFNRR